MTEETNNDENTVYVCSHCSAEETEQNGFEVHGEYLCQSCLENKTFWCQECEEYEYNEFCYTLEGDSLCEHCYNDLAIECDECWNNFREDSPNRFDVGFNVFCSEECFDENHFFCAECDRDYHIEDARDLDGETICYDCYDDIRYNSASGTAFTDSTKFLDTLGFSVGFELEVYPGNTRPLTPALRDVFSCKFDGSLGNNGLEYVSIPCSNDQAYYLANDISNFLIDNDYSVNSDCGFHLHLGGEKIEDKENRLKIMITNLIFKDCLFNMLSPSRQNNQYCSKNRLPLNSLLFTKKARENPEAFYSSYCCRYEFINYKAFYDHNTIENRAHQGTINSRKIINWIKINTRLFDFAINSTYEELVKLRGNAIEFKREILKDEDLINYYEKRVKKFKRKTVRKRRSVYHGIKNSLKQFKPRTNIRQDNDGNLNEVAVRFEWDIRHLNFEPKDLLPVMKKEFDKMVKDVKVNVDV